MNKNKALEVMLTEKCCVERQEDISKCDRRCGECDLLLPTEEVLQAYDFVINMLTEKERPQGEWIKITKNGTIPVEYICSVCGRKIFDNYDHQIPQSEFCPFCHCGADMRGGADND